MRQEISKKIGAYWRSARSLTYDTADKQEIYGTLGRAEALIAVLAAEIARLESPTGRRDGTSGGAS